MHDFTTFPAPRLSGKSLVIINGKFRKKTELYKIVNLSHMQTDRQSTCEQNSQWGIHVSHHHLFLLRLLHRLCCLLYKLAICYRCHRENWIRHLWGNIWFTPPLQQMFIITACGRGRRTIVPLQPLQPHTWKASIVCHGYVNSCGHVADSKYQGKTPDDANINTAMTIYMH